MTLIVGFVKPHYWLRLARPLGTWRHISRRAADCAGRALIITAMFIDTMPSFWIGLLLMLLLTLQLRWLPATGALDYGDPVGVMRRLALPVIVLAIGQLATVARITRTAVLDVMNEDYIRTARAPWAPAS